MSKKRKDWTEKELYDLSVDYGVLLPSELVNKYSVDYDYIRRICSKYSIKSHRNVRMRKWEEQELQNFIKDWKENVLTSFDLETKYNRQYNSLKGKAKDLKITRQTNVDILSEEDIDSICSLYSANVSSMELSKKYNICQSSILKILRAGNVDIKDNSHCKRYYKINEHYFDNIDDEHKAYWLGLLFADGYNQECRNSIILTLKEEDKYILTNLLDDLESNYCIKPLYNKKFNSTAYKIRISNKRISEQLKEKGVVQNKTFISNFPNIDNNLIRHFIRGYFDGDGCISLSMRGVNNDRMYATFSIVNGNYDFLKELNLKMNIDCDKIISPVKNIYQIAYNKYSEIIKLYDYLYSDATIYLKRKNDKFIDYLKYKEGSGHFAKNKRISTTVK